jgi:predicted glycosyltransferase
MASEAVLLGLPTLLVTKAVRGFIDRLIEDGYPLFVVREHDESILAAWLAGMHLTDAIEVPDWPDTKSEMLDFIKH